MKKILSIAMGLLLILPSAFAGHGDMRGGWGQNDRVERSVERAVQRHDARQDRYDRYNRRDHRGNDRRDNRNNGHRDGNIGGIIAGVIIGGIIAGAINDQRNAITCYAQNQYGEIFRVRGYNNSYNGYSVQNQALSVCYSYSYSCRPLGCQY